MRRLGCATQVRLSRDGTPRAFTVHGGWRQVEQVVEAWREAGCWWEGEHPRQFVRVDAGGWFDLSCDAGDDWRIEVAWD
jgi:hypothetical protein